MQPIQRRQQPAIIQGFCSYPGSTKVRAAIYFWGVTIAMTIEAHNLAAADPVAAPVSSAGYDRPAGDPHQSRSAVVAQHGIVAAGAGDATEVLLRGARAERGVSLHFSKREFPYFTLWKSTQAAADGYVTGLEPGVNLPNERPFEEEQKRVVNLAGGESRTLHLRLEAHGTSASVATAAKRIAELAKGAAPKVLPRPQLPWAPVGS